MKTRGTGKALKVNWDTNETFEAYYAGGETPLVFNKTDGNAFVATDVPEGVNASTSFTGVYGENVTYNPSTGKYTIDYRNQNGTLANLAMYDVMSATSTADAEGLHFPFKHKNAFLKVTLKRGNSTCTASEKSQKVVTIHLKECKLADDNMSIVDSKNSVTDGEKTTDVYLSLNLSTALSLNESRVIYIAIPPLTSQSASWTSLGGGIGYHKDVDMKTSNLKFDAGKVYETSIDFQASVWGTGAPD